MRQILIRQFGTNSIFAVDGFDVGASVRRYKRLSRAQTKDIHVIFGHMPFGWHEVLEEPVTYVTLLREPVARIASHYQYVLRTPDAVLHNETVTSALTLSDYPIRSSGASVFNNGQTRLLAGPLLAEDFSPTDNTLEVAKRNLSQHFAIAGVTERFDESLILMAGRLGWKAPLYSSFKVAPHPYPQKELDVARDTLLARNELDHQLHRFASDRLEDLISTGLSDRYLQVYRWKNRLFRLYQQLGRLSRRAVEIQ